MADGAQNVVKWVTFALTLAQLGLAVLMIVLVRFRLHSSTGDIDGCILAPSWIWSEACTYADVVASISMLFTFVASLMQLYFTHKQLGGSSRLSSPAARKQLCGVPAQHLHLAVLVAAVCWWVAAAGVLTHYTVQAEAASLSQSGLRVLVLACCWLSVVLFCALIGLEVWRQRAAAAALAQLRARSGISTASSGLPQAMSFSYMHQPSFLSPYAAGSFASGGVALGIPVVPMLRAAPASAAAAADAPAADETAAAAVAAAPAGTIQHPLSTSIQQSTGSGQLQDQCAASDGEPVAPRAAAGQGGPSPAPGVPVQQGLTQSFSRPVTTVRYAPVSRDDVSGRTGSMSAAGVTINGRELFTGAFTDWSSSQSRHSTSTQEAAAEQTAPAGSAPGSTAADASSASGVDAAAAAKTVDVSSRGDHRP